MLTHYSNFNTVFPSNNIELARQIDILKQCTKDEIKIVTTRIQILEKHIKQMNPNACVNDDEIYNKMYFQSNAEVCFICARIKTNAAYI